MLGTMTMALYLGEYFRMGSRDDLFGLFSLELDENSYPIKVIENVRKQDISGAYRARTWVKVKGCTALYERKKGDLITLGVRPSEDIDILGAKEVDRGVWEVVVDRKEIESVWEEREPYLDFPFPDEIDKLVMLDVMDL